MERGSGILMHISSLYGPHGIGTFGRSAYEFVDFLERSGQKYWQILPLNPTSYGDSPYQSPSAFAGNHNFIDFDILKNKKLLKYEDYEGISFGIDSEKIDYRLVFEHKINVLKLAYENHDMIDAESMQRFKEENEYWLEDYAIFMAIKYENDFKSWYEWEEDIKLRRPEALIKHKEKLKDKIEFWIFTQYLFYEQWRELKNYANEKNIKIIGDIPIYVAEDSVDIWSRSENFSLDENKVPIEVAGVPPDDFSDEGQYWGNPIYDWEYLKDDNYDWWIERIKLNLKLYDILRLDHFRGFESYWSIPKKSITAKAGRWKEGPGIEFFDELKAKLGDIPLIIEDLGQKTDGLVKLKEAVGYPPMKVIQFAFSSGADNEHLPHLYEKNQIAYTGTHDNQTLKGWIEDIETESLNYAERYLTLNGNEGYNWGIIRGVWGSVAKIAIAQMQDFLNLDNSSRMNTPNTKEGNWSWRIKSDFLSDELADKIKGLTKIYGR